MTVSRARQRSDVRRLGYFAKCAWAVRAWAVRASMLMLSGLNPSCLVDEKCYLDADCSAPKICGSTGECELECRVNSDCDARRGVEYQCRENRCIYPVQCAYCAFPNAESSCMHGVCQPGACSSGYLDLNRDARDGCEYACHETGAEVCDGVDNDCDGQVDEALDDCNYLCTPTGAETCDAVDNDCDGLVDEDEVCRSSCPADMVPVGLAHCVDRYEASRVDATVSSQGVDGSMALSRAGVLPWMVNPMTEAHLGEFQAACAAAGKELCSPEEWFSACTGPEQTPFVYGNAFNRETCNCVDTCCDDYCAAHSIGSTSCELTSNCGYTYDCFGVAPTGQFTGCTNEFGTLDMNGNVWEVVRSGSDPRGYELRGGAFNCASAATRVNCSFNANWTALYAGFRCCKRL